MIENKNHQTSFITVVSHDTWLHPRPVPSPDIVFVITSSSTCRRSPLLLGRTYLLPLVP